VNILAVSEATKETTAARISNQPLNGCRFFLKFSIQLKIICQLPAELNENDS
jgi:hypothetical protein